MPYDGSGTFTPLGAPNFPVISGTPIISTYYNAVINDVASGVSNALTKDGQGRPSANINWNAKDLTNVATFGSVSASIGTITGTTSITTPALVVSTSGTFSDAGGNLVVDFSGGVGRILQSGTNGLYIGTTGATSLVFYTNNNQVFSLGTSGQVASANRADAVGYKGSPVISLTSNYLLNNSALGVTLLNPAVPGFLLYVTIPVNTSWPLPIGYEVSLACLSSMGMVVDKDGGVTLYDAASGSSVVTASVGTNKIRKLIKLDTDVWMIYP